MHIRKFFTALAISAAAMYASHAQAEDIAGFKLGMTVDEVKEVAEGMEGFNVKVKEEQFRYYDGVKTNMTDPFVSTVVVGRLEGNSNGLYRTDYELRFATPPQANTLVYLKRDVKYKGEDAPAKSTFREALVEKYGQPDIEKTALRIDNLNWGFGDGVKCFDPIAQSTHLGNGTLESLISIVKNKHAEVTACGQWIQYALNGDPVKRDSAVMADLGAIAKMQLATQEWLAGLEAGARGEVKENSKSNKPSL